MKTPKKPIKNVGFTLLEVLIASALFALFTSHFSIIQHQSVQSTILAEEFNIALMLAQSKMAEYEMENLTVPFNQLKEEENGTFDKPHDYFQWKTTIKEIKIPAKAMLAFFSQTSADTTKQPSQVEAMALQIMTDYISKSVREITLEVVWSGNSGEEKLSFSTYLIDLDQPISLGI